MAASKTANISMTPALPTIEDLQNDDHSEN